MCTGRWTPFALGLVSVALAALAVYRDGRWLVWDEPLQRSVESHRYPVLDDAFAALTHLGSLAVMLPVAVGAVILVWPRCRALSPAIVVAVGSSVVLTYGLKSLVGRERPDTGQLVDFEFHSFPSGHVVQAVALWGMLPPIVALLTERRSWWFASVAVAGVIVGLTAASRVYLGVHWFSDVLGGLLAGAVALLAAETTFRYVHRRRPCGSTTTPASTTSSGAAKSR